MSEIPEVVKRYRKLIRSLYPWTVRPTPLHDPSMALLVDGNRQRGILSDQAWSEMENLDLLQYHLKRRQNP